MINYAINYIFIYFVLWWILIFITLPLYMSPKADASKGYDSGAPEQPRLKKKFLLNSIITAIATYALLAWLNAGGADFLREF